MEQEFLISALSLFTGASLVPAGFYILSKRNLPVDRNHTVEGTMAILIAFIVLCLGTMFLLNTVAQDTPLFLALLGILVTVPTGLIAFDKRRRN